MNGHELAASIFGKETFESVPCLYEHAVGLWIGGTCVSWVGMAQQHILMDWKGIRVAGIGFVCTEEKYRRRGFMRTLMDIAHQEARKLSCSYAMLNTGMPYLYEPLGYFHPPNLPAEWMVCHLWSPSEDRWRRWDDEAVIDFMGRTW